MDVPISTTNGPAPVLLATVMCEDDARAERDGRLSLQRVFYNLRPTALPLRQDFSVVAFWWLRGAGQRLIATRVLDADGGVIEELARAVDHQGEHTLHEQVARFVGLEFAQPGIYRVEVLLDGEVVGAYPLLVEPPVLTVQEPVVGESR